MSNESEREDPADDELRALVAEALGQKGELLPTTEREVQLAEQDGVAFEGPLPAGLESYREPRSDGAREAASIAGSDAAPLSRAGAGAASVKLVSLAAHREEKHASRRSALGFVGSFGLGAVAAAAALLLFWPRPLPGPDDPRMGAGTDGSATPAQSAEARALIAPVQTGCADCCAGAACPKAEGDLAQCGSGRRCIACGESSGAFKIRLGNLQPASAIDSDKLAAFDLCARIASGPWSCEPAATVTPGGRILPGIAAIADISSGIALEVRFRGTTQVLGRWRDSVRMGPTVLCRGIGVLLKTGEGADLGGVSMFFDDPYYVELGRSDEIEALKRQRGLFEFSDVVPAIFETRAPAPRSFVLAAGPFDQATAERLRWALLEKSTGATVTLGDDLVPGGRSLP